MSDSEERAGRADQKLRPILQWRAAAELPSDPPSSSRTSTLKGAKTLRVIVTVSCCCPPFQGIEQSCPSSSARLGIDS